MGEAAVESLAKSRMLTPDVRHEISQFISSRMSIPHDDKEQITNSKFYVRNLYNDNKELEEKIVRMYSYDFELMKDILECT